MLRNTSSGSRLSGLTLTATGYVSQSFFASITSLIIQRKTCIYFKTFNSTRTSNSACVKGITLSMLTVIYYFVCEKTEVQKENDSIPCPHRPHYKLEDEYILRNKFANNCSLNHSPLCL